MTKYYIVPKPGYTVDDVLFQGLNPENAIIVAYTVEGAVKEVHRYNHENVERYKPELHPQFHRARKMFELYGRMITLDTGMFEGYLADGWNPFKQIICTSVEVKGMSKEDIIDLVIKRRKFLANTENNRWWLSELVEYLTAQGWLHKVFGRYIRGDRKMPIGQQRFAVKDGYNPILYQIMVRVESQPEGITRTEIADYMIRDLGWIEHDPITRLSAEEQLDIYLNYLKEKGYIKEIAKGRFAFVKPLEKYM
jgi:hypothetical protein